MSISNNKVKDVSKATELTETEQAQKKFRRDDIFGRKFSNLVVEVEKVIPGIDIGKHEFNPKRARYYHSIVDRRLLKSGETYKKLGNVFVIIIMPSDP